MTSELAEISLVASPSELRAMVVFLNSVADEMKRMGTTYDHVHLSDRHETFEESPRFVVFRSATQEAS
ncbi:MAG TPA: hypothetical protein VGC55_13595 [Dokdonella sp.]